MAAKVPTVRGETGYLDPNNTAKIANIITANEKYRMGEPGVATYYFDDIDTTDTYTISNWRGLYPTIKWTADALGGSSASASLVGTTLTITWVTSAVNQLGWLEIDSGPKAM